MCAPVCVCARVHMHVDTHMCRLVDVIMGIKTVNIRPIIWWRYWVNVEGGHLTNQDLWKRTSHLTIFGTEEGLHSFLKPLTSHTLKFEALLVCVCVRACMYVRVRVSEWYVQYLYSMCMYAGQTHKFMHANVCRKCTNGRSIGEAALAYVHGTLILICVNL
jgi:hypothetical protein